MTVASTREIVFSSFSVSCLDGLLVDLSPYYAKTLELDLHDMLWTDGSWAKEKAVKIWGRFVKERGISVIFCFNILRKGIFDKFICFSGFFYN